MRRRVGRVLVLGQRSITAAAGFAGQLYGGAMDSQFRPVAVDLLRQL